MEKYRTIEFPKESDTIARNLANKQFAFIEEILKKRTENITEERNLAKAFCNIMFNELKDIVLCVESGEYDTEYDNGEELLNDLYNSHNSFNELGFSADFNRAGRVEFQIEKNKLIPMFTYKNDIETIIFKSSFEYDLSNLMIGNTSEYNNYKDILEEINTLIKV